MPKPKKVKIIKEKIEEKKSEPIFELTVLCMGETHHSVGDDLTALLKNFTPPPLFKTATNIIVRKAGKTVQRDLKVYDARRLFNNKTSLELFINNLTRQLV